MWRRVRFGGLLGLAAGCVVWLVPAIHAQAEPSFIDNVCFNGQDIAGGAYTGISDFPACRTLCESNSLCLSWAFLKPAGPGGGTCYLKDGVPFGTGVQSNVACVSGRRLESVDPSWMLENLSQPGNDIGSAVVIRDAQPKDCAETCRANETCQGWTYVKPGIISVKPLCYLKSPLPLVRIPDERVISGFVERRIGTLRTVRAIPGDIDSKYARLSDAAACRNACEADAYCRSWSFAAEKTGDAAEGCYTTRLDVAEVANPCCTSAKRTTVGLGLRPVDWGIVVPPSPPPLETLTGYEVLGLGTSGPGFEPAPKNPPAPPFLVDFTFDELVTDNLHGESQQCPPHKVALAAGHSFKASTAQSLLYGAELKGAMVGRSITRIGGVVWNGVAYPTDTLVAGWKTRDANLGDSVLFRGTVVCVDRPANLVARNGSGSERSSVAHCGSQETMLGGGFETTENGLFPQYGYALGTPLPGQTDRSSATGGNWNLEMALPAPPNDPSFRDKVFTRALCVPGADRFGAFIAYGPTQTIPGGQNMRTLEVLCGAGYRAINGGHNGSGPTISMLTVSSEPIGDANNDGWRVTVANRSVLSGDIVTTTPFALCARAVP